MAAKNMLFLLFQLGDDGYALEAGQVVEVIPMVELKKIPCAPPAVAGVFNYRGTPVPAIDLCQLALNRPASLCLSTRLILLNYPVAGDEPRLLSVIAERATSAIHLERSSFSSTGVTIQAAPYLGPVASGPRGLIQLVEIKKLLPESVRDLLFRQPVTQP